MIRKLSLGLFVGSAVFVLSPGLASAQQAIPPVAKGHVFIPKGSVAQPEDAGINAHTHLRMFVPANGMNYGASAVQTNELPPFPGFFFETPASLGCIYHLVPHSIPGCNPNSTKENPNAGKGSGAIALIDAFDDPTAASDLATFSAQFGLPAPNLTVVFSTGTRPGLDPSGTAEIEESLDIEWAHAMAPNAKLFLIEAPSLNLIQLFEAAQIGASLVAANGGGEVSMSFGTGEGLNEAVFDPVFVFPGVVFLASSGDSPGVEYPSASPNVISAGGTTISRDPNRGTFLFENTWQDAGGGPSQVEPRPAFQNEVAFIVGDSRGTPDLSFDANPNTGVWIFDSNPVFGTGWFVVGGTSVSAPSLAGVINSAGSFSDSSQAENAMLYRHVFGGAFNDIVFGNCGLNIGNFALPGYDFCTGLGSPNTLRHK
jgi:kumamolisin